MDRTLQILNRESTDLGRDSVNRTVLGRPRIVPIGDALVHVQPVYVTAGGSGYPRLQLVTVHVNGRVGYGRDLQTALRAGHSTLSSPGRRRRSNARTSIAITQNATANSSRVSTRRERAAGRRTARA